MYRIFNVAIDSELALPELPGLSDPAGVPVFRFALARGAELAARSAAVDWFHDWLDPHGHVTIRAGRGDGSHWLRFPRLADFSIDRVSQSITVFPEPATDEPTLRHLLLDQVMPRVLGQQGALVLHAGAVQVAGGETLAFVGETGRGKSTLVSSFEQNGARLITDDCLMLVQDEGVARVIPNYPGVRLFDDSIRAIYGAGRGVENVAQYTSKRRVALVANGMDLEEEAASLDALFLLGDPAEAGSEGVDIRLASGADSLMSLVAQSFLLDFTDKALMAELFRAAGTLLRGNVRCYTLNYPRVHDRLDELREAIERVAP